MSTQPTDRPPLAQDRDDANRTENLRLSWERDLESYLDAAGRQPGVDADAHAARLDLARAIHAEPSSAGAWWAFLRHEEAAAGSQGAAATPRGTPRSPVPSLCDLYRWATRLVSRQDAANRAAFVNLWVGYGRQQWLRCSEDDARDTFKTLKSQQIGEEYAVLYAEWAALEAASGGVSKALSILSKGVKAGAEPRGVLTAMKAALEEGRYAYVPFYRLDGVEDPAATPRPGSGAGGAAMQTAAAFPTQTCPQLRAPPFASSAAAAAAQHPASAPSGGTLSAMKPAVSHSSTHTSSSSGVSGRALSTGGATAAAAPSQHQQLTPAGVASASLRTGSSAGTTSSEEATVSNLRASTQTLTSMALAAQARAPAPAPPASAVTPLATSALQRLVLKSPWAGNEAEDPAARKPATSKFGGLGKAMRVAPGAAPPAAAVPEAEPQATPAAAPAPALPSAAYRTPGPASVTRPGAGAVPASAARARLLTPLAPVAEGAEVTPAPSLRAVQPLVPAPVPAPRQLVLEDGPAAADEATARVSSRPAGGYRPAGTGAAVLVGIAEDPGATVPLSRPVVAAAVSGTVAAHAPAVPAAMPPPPAVAQPQQAAPTQQQRQQQALAEARLMPPPPPQPARAAAVPRPAPAQQQQQPSTSGRRVIEDEETVTVRGITYTKLECVGRGGSSKVYKVMAPNKKIFALKRIRLSGCDAEAAAGFLDEITLLNRLRGRSNIIQLIDSEVHRAQSLIYMVLEYGDIDLARLLQKQEAARRERAQAAGAGALPPTPGADMQPADENFVRLYWQQMLQAVDTIHRERIVHSDLKPANFLVVEGQLKLIDFGIAKAIQSDTTSIARESQVGTLNYMSPEAILGGASGGPRGGPPMKVGRASDIWSLGCIIYQMAYGRTPFAHLPFIQKMHAITDDRHSIEFPPLRNAALLDVIKRCLDRNPRTRITMAELLDHPFLAPTHMGTPAGTPAGAGGGAGRVELNEEQLRKLLLKVCATGGVSDANVGALSGQLFKQLAEGTLSPDVGAAKAGRRPGAAADENVEPMQLN